MKSMKSKVNEAKRKNFKIRKDDVVRVIAGKEKGKTGRVINVLRDKNRVVVEKLMMIKRHTKAQKQQGGGGGVVEKEGSIHISNVMLMCGKCNKPTRVGYAMLESGQKERICQKCREVIM